MTNKKEKLFDDPLKHSVLCCSEWKTELETLQMEPKKNNLSLRVINLKIKKYLTIGTFTLSFAGTHLIVIIKETI